MLVCERVDDELLKSKLRVALAEKEIKHSDFAEQLEVTKQTLSGWVTGRTNPTLETALKISYMLDKPVNELWEYKDKNGRE